MDGLIEEDSKEENLCIICSNPQRASTIDEELNQIDR